MRCRADKAQQLRHLLIVVLVLLPLAAAAQRVDDNAVTAADDAFGTTVGTQVIGLYDTDGARGFSPKDAGNLRIDGLYFDQQTFEANRCLIAGTVGARRSRGPGLRFSRAHRDRQFLAARCGARQPPQRGGRTGPVRRRSVEFDGQYGPAGAPVSASICCRRAVNVDFDFARNMQDNDYGLISGQRAVQ